MRKFIAYMDNGEETEWIGIIDATGTQDAARKAAAKARNIDISIYTENCICVVEVKEVHEVMVKASRGWDVTGTKTKKVRISKERKQQEHS